VSAEDPAGTLVSLGTVDQEVLGPSGMMPVFGLGPHRLIRVGPDLVYTNSRIRHSTQTLVRGFPEPESPVLLPLSGF